MSCFVIAEAGVNHCGSEELALQLIDIAADSGADAIKFQSFKAESLVSQNAEKAEYQKRQTGEGNQFQMLKRLEMSDEMHINLLERCKAKGIEFMSTGFDEESTDFLESMGMNKFKVPSGELTNIPLIKHIAKKMKPIILSTGMGELSEIESALVAIRQARNLNDNSALSDVTVLHCTSNYPALPEDVNLKAMSTIESEFGISVGYSDHTLGIEVPIAAVSRGASVIEKHFTISKKLSGPDHAASLEPHELKTMVSAIRLIEKALGDGVKAPTKSELDVRKLVRKSIHVTTTLNAGDIIGPKDVMLLRPDSGLAPRFLSEVIGKSVTRDIEAGSPLTDNDIAL